MDNLRIIQKFYVKMNVANVLTDLNDIFCHLITVSWYSNRQSRYSATQQCIQVFILQVPAFLGTSYFCSSEKLYYYFLSRLFSLFNLLVKTFGSVNMPNIKFSTSL